MIPIAIVGLGNCAAALLEGIQYLREEPDVSAGVITPLIGGYEAIDIEPVIAFDIDRKKVGKPIGEAAEIGNQRRMQKPLAFDAVVHSGMISDGLSATSIVDSIRWDTAPSLIASEIEESGAKIVVNYLPVGSTEATRQYAAAALLAGAAFVNCIPVKIARDPAFARQFDEANLPLIGDDIKSQYGATILHRALARIAEERGITILDTYQLNVGGNADFRNMLDTSRLQDKKESKTGSVTDVVPVDDERIHIGPSDFIPHLGDTKVAYINLSMTGFAGAPIDLEARLKVSDSPNSAGIVVEAVRYAAKALDENVGGVLDDVSAWLMKAPRNHDGADVAV